MNSKRRDGARGPRCVAYVVPLRNRQRIPQSRRDLDRVRLLNDQEVDTLICGGLQESFEDLVTARGIHVISWVVGEVEDVLGRFLRGELASGQNSRRQHQHDVSHANTEDGSRCKINSSKKPTP